MRRFWLLVAILAAMPAYATRLTPSTRLTNQAQSSGAQTSTVDIPSGATWAIIGFCYYNDTGPNATVRPSSVTLDGQSATLVASAGSSATYYAAIYKVAGFATGASKTLGFTLSATGLYFANDINVEYRDNTPTYGASDAANTTGFGPASTSALANTSGDEIISLYCSKDTDGTADPAVGTGQTKLDDTYDSAGSLREGFTTETGSGTSDVQSIGVGGTGSLPAIASVVVTTAAGAFDSTPAVTGLSTTAYTVTGSLSGAGTVDAVACPAGQTAPTKTQVSATHCTGDVAAAASDTQSPSSGPFDFSLTLTPSQSPAYPLYDIYVTDGTTLTTLASEFLSPPSTCGENSNQPCQFVQLSSVAIGGVASIATLPYDGQTVNFVVGDTAVGGTSGARCQIRSDSDSGATGTLNCWIESGTFQDNEALTGTLTGAAVVNGTATYLYAANDVLVAPTYPMPGGTSLAIPNGCTYRLCFDADGNAHYSSNLERETALNITVYDYSAQGYASGDIDFVNNDATPNCSGTTTIVLLLNVAMTAVDLDDYCLDTDFDALTSTEIGTLPTGLSLTGSTNVTSGTPTVENESGVTITYFVADPYSALATKSIVYYPIDTLTMPDCTSSATTATDCEQTISSTFHGAISFATSLSEPNANIPVGDVSTQSPAAGVETAPFSTVTLTLATAATMPNCLASTVTVCTAAIAAVSATASLNQSTGCTGGSSVIYSQAPAVGTAVSAGFSLTVFCR